MRFCLPCPFNFQILVTVMKQTMNKELKEICEQIQEDIISYCDYMDPEGLVFNRNGVVDELCQIVVDNFKKANE